MWPTHAYFYYQMHLAGSPVSPSGWTEDCCLEAKYTIDYSIIVPVYNGSRSLEILCTKTTAALENFSIEIILVDDASTDESWEVIQQLKNKFHCIIPLQNRKNKGQCASLLIGFAYSSGQFIITLDDDLQFDPIDILHLVERQKQTNACIVYGLPVKAQHSWVRNSFSRIVKKTAGYAGYPSKGSSFRLLKKEVMAKAAIRLNQKNVLLDLAFYRAGYQIEFVPLPHYKRKHGKSGYTFFKLVRLMVNSVAEHTRIVFLKQQRK